MRERKNQEHGDRSSSREHFTEAHRSNVMQEHLSLSFVSFPCVTSEISLNEILRYGRDCSNRSTDTSSPGESLLES